MAWWKVTSHGDLQHKSTSYREDSLIEKNHEKKLHRTKNPWHGFCESFQTLQILNSSPFFCLFHFKCKHPFLHFRSSIFLYFSRLKIKLFVSKTQNGGGARSIYSRCTKRISSWKFKTTDSTIDKDLHIEWQTWWVARFFCYL